MKLHQHLIAEVVEALHDIFVDGRYADKVIEYRFKAHPKWGARDRKLFAESVYDIVRGWRWYWHLAGQLDSQSQDAEAIVIPRIWKVWAAYWITLHGSTADFSQVRDITLEMIRRRDEACTNPAIRASVPDWLYELGLHEFRHEWAPMIAALNKPADVFLRANTLRTTAEDLQAKLAQEEILADLVPGLPDALRLQQRRNVFTSQAFKEGLFELQDGASQKVAPFLEIAPGMKVVDACAGAGGKALHMGSLMKNKGRIIALDVHQKKLDELRRRSARNGVDVIETRVIEPGKTIKKLSVFADRVLLDVPCSGLGVLRRNPDAKWKLTQAEIDRLVALQGTILADYARIVKPGGKLVYATCSVLPAENELQVKAFLDANPDEWALDDQFTLWPHRDGFDGFYAARLVRKDVKPVALAKVETPEAPEEA